MALVDLEMLACAETRIGMICLWRGGLPSDPRTLVTEITLDHTFLMSSHFSASERAFAARAFEMHPKIGAKVLVGGLGLGHTAHAALENQAAARVDVVELLPEVIGWLDRGLIPLGAELKANPRFSVTQGDVYQKLASPPNEKYDVILIDVDHSPERPLDPASTFFYSAAGLELAKAHLEQSGILGVWSYAESATFADTLRRVFREVRIDTVTADNPKLDEEETNWLFFARA